MANERHTAAFVVGLALGGLAGASYVLFKTPRSGAEVRAGIAARIQGLAGTVRETAGVVGVETLRAGEQTVERLEATGAAVRDRLPGICGVADLVPGNRAESGAAEPKDPAAPSVRPDTPASVDEMSDAIAGEAGGPEPADIADEVPVAPPGVAESLEAVSEANLTRLPSVPPDAPAAPDSEDIEASRPPERALNSSA